MKRIFELIIFQVLALMMISWSGPKQSPETGDKDTLDLKGKIRVNSFMLNVVSPSSGVRFYRNGILFLSNTKNEKKMAANHISFGTFQAYYAAFGDSSIMNHKVFTSNIPFTFPCDAVTFTSDFKTIYFTMIPRDGEKEKIYQAKIVSPEKDPGILDIRELDFCTGNSVYTHPALSNDGNMLVFASDSKGSGGMDLFISSRKDGKWTTPVNAGKLINTAGNEYFPFLDKDNNLYYSSDKLPGIGGYDIFTCKYNGTGWDRPVNLGEEINSTLDDIAFSADENGNTAFFTRKKGNSMKLMRVDPVIKSGQENLITAIYGTVTKNQTTIPKDTINNQKALPMEPKIMPETTAVAPKTGNRNTAGKETSQNKAQPNAVIIKPTLPAPDSWKDVVIYRVQILASPKPLREKDIILNGVHYNLYEYYYLNAYRYSIGEFRTLQPAVDLQKLCRQSGYAQAFVAAFKNNLRSVDLKSFK